MTSPLLALSQEHRRALATAFRGVRLSPPYTAIALQRYVGQAAAVAVAKELQRLASEGMEPRHLTTVFELMADAPEGRSSASLVWSGPEEVGTASRDTGVVVRELFQRADEDVLVAGFAVYQGKEVFKILADRMDQNPALRVRMFLNVDRKGNEPSDATILLGFLRRFRHEQWPGQRLPELYHDPRALHAVVKGAKRATLHAKCVVVDGRLSLVTSANFTEAAQLRNIEAGTLVDDVGFARSLLGQFESLIRAGGLLRLA